MPRIGRVGRRYLLLLVTTVAVATVVALFLARARLFPGLIERAVAAYDRGEWSAAAALADERLKSVPDDREAVRLLARSSVRQGRDNAARMLYTRLGGAAAMHAEDYYLFGTVINRLGDRETARECWEQGLRDQPNHPGLLFELARLFHQMSRFEAATKLADHLATQAGWEARGDLLLAQIKYGQDDQEGAALHLHRALDLDPAPRGGIDSPVPYRKLLAQALLRTGRPAEAIRQLQTVLTAGPDPEASWLLSRSYLQTRSIREASTALEQSEKYREQHPLVPEPALYVGSARCASCHASIYKSEQTSLHSSTFQRGTELKGLPLPDHPIRDPAEGGVSHTIKRLDGQVELETRDHDKAYRALVDYAFGSGDRGLSLVGHDHSGRVRELRLSYYADGSAWDVTSGHLSQRPSGENFLGRPLSADDVQSCLFCHTTVARSARDRTGPEGVDRGIGCERCHGPGGNHLTAVELGFPDLAIARPGPNSGPQVVKMCAQCHSPLVQEVSKTDPIAVRFPGTTLTWSKCFTASNATFDCLTCHNPHRNAEKSPAFYEDKCLSCHSKPAALTSNTPHGPDGSRQTVCPVSPQKGCLTCHMPTVKTAIPHSTFTDHDIRVHPRTDSTTRSGGQLESRK
jgi:tetratricopeptide (TPR) repeat protein